MDGGVLHQGVNAHSLCWTAGTSSSSSGVVCTLLHPVRGSPEACCRWPFATAAASAACVWILRVDISFRMTTHLCTACDGVRWAVSKRNFEQRGTEDNTLCGTSTSARPRGNICYEHVHSHLMAVCPLRCMCTCLQQALNMLYVLYVYVLAAPTH